MATNTVSNISAINGEASTMCQYFTSLIKDVSDAQEGTNKLQQCHKHDLDKQSCDFTIADLPTN